MKIQDKCLPCIVNQAIKVADMVGLQDKNELLKKVFGYVSQEGFEKSCTPELIGEVFQLIKDETGKDDPYKKMRRYYNELLLGQIPVIENEINQTEHQFSEAVKYAIIGNIIDFNPIHNRMLYEIQECFQKLKNDTLEIDDSKQLIQEMKTAKTVLYLGDNCGEICLDKILIKKMKEMYPLCHIYFGTRGEAVVNDSIEEDAYFVGMDEYATILSNGDSSLGTVLHRTSERLQEVYREADIVIAKGQANYECLSDEKKNIYFLLMTKCDVIAKDIGTTEMKMICMKSRKQ